MPLLIQRIVRGLTPARLSADRPPAQYTSPDRIVLGVRAGHRPSDKPPVRIFLGTERNQFRAERIFLWSIEKHRDPSRIYEIFLMRDIKGFSRGFWLTGFTNYRFAIPGFAHFKGRAIYNDADQVYLTDPAKLFDTPMNGKGFLSINDRDTSVMLIDCERMADAWNDHDVRRLSRKALEARARQAGLWGDLDDGWNARDSEYHPNRSHLVHFTTLHTQPWRPFPDQLVYFDNPTDPLWQNLEHEADQAAFMPVSATRPSRDWANLRLFLSSRPDGQQLDALLGSRTDSIERVDSRRLDGLLELVPDQDVPWVLERLFRFSGSLEVTIREPRSQASGRLRRSRWFWVQQFQQASRLHPQTRWRLRHRTSTLRQSIHTGGPAAPGAIALLLHRKPGHNHQARAIAEALAVETGREIREIRLTDSDIGFFLRRALGLFRAADSEGIAVVIAGGWLPSRVARAMRKRQPDLRLVVAGRKSGPLPDTNVVGIQCPHFGLPPHPNRLLSELPLNGGVSSTTMDTDRWQTWLNAPRKAAVLLGGASRSHRMDRNDAQALGNSLARWQQEHGYALLLVGSRRSQSIDEAVAGALPDSTSVYHWQADDPGNPYQLALREADCLIVTGESESMMSDALASGRGFLIWPLAEKSPSPWRRFSRWVADTAVRPRFNRRGSIRPQQGLRYACARLLARHWVIPPRRLDTLHQTLYDRGLAAPFGQPVPTSFKSEQGLERIIPRLIERLELRPALPSKSQKTTKESQDA
ncbi:MAG: ELM1/GtrOC1 family putative glycosyltransferase [Wenzhouxiangella sp.]